jgi:ParB-like chromosome segregation protein Spo0J
MKITRLKTKDLIPNERNVRTHSEKQIKEFAKSIEMFGVVRPVVVDENNMLIAGHGLWLTLQHLGIEEVDAVVMTGLSESEKLKLMLADNKIYELGNTNFDYFNEILKEISLGGDLNIPGFDEDILSSLIADDLDVDVNIQNYGTLEDEHIQEIKNQGEELEQKLQKENTILHATDEGVREVELNPEKIQVEVNEDFADGNPRPFVICEHCGEKIWL